MNQNLSKELINSVIYPSASQVYIDIGEAILDTKIDGDLLRNIPILNAVYNISKTIISISDQLFLKKVLSFLHELDKVNKDKVSKFRLKMETDSKFQRKVGDKLMFIIDKCEDDEKSVIIGKIFGAYLSEEITYNEFTILSKSIEQLSISDINHLITSRYWDFSSDANLINSGLLWQELTRGDETQDELEFIIYVSISTLGKKLKLILSK